MREDNPLRELTLEELQRRTSVKWRSHPPDVLPLSVAEMDVRLPACVVRAITDAASSGDTGYANGPLATSRYASAYAAFAAARWGWEMNPAHCCAVPDVLRGFVGLLRALSHPGDAVVLNYPSYPLFSQLARSLGRAVVPAVLGDDGRLDFRSLAFAFEEAVRGGRGAVFLLCSPHSPTGTVHRTVELAEAVDLAGQFGVRVVADEAHAPLTLAGARFVPLLSVPGSTSAFSLVSAGKAFNLGGLKAALVVAGPRASANLVKLRMEDVLGCSHLSVIAHCAALTEGHRWLDNLLSGLDGNRRLLGALQRRWLPEVSYRPAQGTYFAWLDCRGLQLARDPAEVFLEFGRVAVISGADYGQGGAGHVRLNLATTPEVLTQAVRRMAQAVGPRPADRRGTQA
ncbi:aminotransferase class I/II-fold pyridoxal phosphate-dependent enzyme [Streptomyces sp. NPDC023327]|uniref:MalY/PatB family protein n=1 Tax=Streptomyces sp. NPDC023327 TaxID=3157088 RepID=UPI00340BC88E